MIADTMPSEHELVESALDCATDDLYTAAANYTLENGGTDRHGRNTRKLLKAAAIAYASACEALDEVCELETEAAIAGGAGP